MNKFLPVKHLRRTAMLIAAIVVSISSFAGPVFAADAITGKWIGSGGQYRNRLHTIAENGASIEIRAAESYSFPEFTSCSVSNNQLLGKFQFAGTDSNGYRRYLGQWIEWTVSSGVCTISGPSAQYTASLRPGDDVFQRPPLQYGPDNNISIYAGSVPLSAGLPFNANFGFYRKSEAITKLVPHIAVGNFGSLYSTIIQIINTGSRTVTVTGTFYKQDGATSAATYTTNLTSVPSFTGTLSNASLAANSVLVITGAGANNPAVLDGAVNWAKFVTSGSVTISTFFEVRDFSGRLLTRVGVSSSPTDLSNFMIPRFRNPATGSDSGFAVVNTGTSTANITVTLKDSTGSTLAARTLNMNPNTQTAQYLAGFLSGAGCSPCLAAETGSTTRYHFILFSSTASQFAAIGLGAEGDVYASFPVEPQ